MQAVRHGRRAVEQAVEDVLGGPEFDSQTSQLAELLRRLDPDFDFSLDLSRGVAWITAGLLAALLVVVLVRALRDARRRRRAAAPAAGGEFDVARHVRALLADGRAARARGDLRGALRAYVAALVVGLGQGSGLRYHPAWTNRELLRRGEPDAAAREVLLPIVGDLEPKEFGREPVLPADLDRLERLCAEHLPPELTADSRAARASLEEVA